MIDILELDKSVTALARAIEAFKRDSSNFTPYNEVFQRGGALLGLCSRIHDTAKYRLGTQTDRSRNSTTGARVAENEEVEKRQLVGRPRIERDLIRFDKHKRHGRSIAWDRRSERVTAAELNRLHAHYIVEFDPDEKCYFMKITPEAGPAKWFRIAAYKKNRIGSWLGIPRVSWKDIHQHGIEGTTELCPFFVADYLKPIGTVVQFPSRNNCERVHTQHE